MAVARNNCGTSQDYFEWLQKVAPSMKDKTTQASWLMLLNAILMGVVVFIGAYAPRYRRHPVIGALFNGAITLFLPIVSITVTAVDSVHELIHSLDDKIYCNDRDHLILFFVWTGAVVVIGISATEVVAGDAREGRNVVPPIMLLIKAIWTAYLTFSTMGGGGGLLLPPLLLLIVQLFVLMFAKLVLKYAAFYKARRSFALGRNPCLIAGYMAELQPQMLVPAAPPALIVMGETKVHDVQVEQQHRHPHGSFSLKRMASSQQAQANRRGGLVTLDRVWGQTTLDVTHKDLCFSFALFKMLRCRFAKYTVSEAGFIKASKFFRETLLHGDDHCERVFGIITDELSFINDYYYSSLPIYYSHPLLPALGIALSLWAIGYCLFVSVGIAPAFVPSSGLFGSQISCELTMTSPGCANDDLILSSLFGMGSLYYDLVPLCLVLAVLVLSETREIASYICSNWTKLALIHHRINQAWWQRPHLLHRCVSCLLKYRRCKLVRNWNDKMRQCSVLVLPRHPRRSTPLHLLLRRLLRLPDVQKKVKVPTAVKAAIFEAIKEESSSSEHGDDRDRGGWRIRPPPPPVPAVSQQLLYACTHGRRPAYTILVWHIATSVFEASQQQPPSSDHNKIVATHLSRYCAYLMASCPELLPDDAEWCRGLYGEVKKTADHVLAKLHQGYSHGQLVQALSAADGSGHEVLRNGAALGKELVESKMVGWEALARFWSRMVLYVAPSENLEAHAEAISHGGELITLLWALLAHAGVVNRFDVDADAAAEGLC